MQARVYVETSVVSYLTANPSRDLIVAGHQKVTKRWWERRGDGVTLHVSEVVLREASAGDPKMAARRLAALEGTNVLDFDSRARDHAASLIESGLVPARSVEDAFHIAIATVNAMDYLLTWNLSTSATPRSAACWSSTPQHAVTSRRSSARRKSCLEKRHEE